MAHKLVGKTDIGCKRENNEDAFGNNVSEAGLIAIVADGMGGHNGGEVASDLAVNCFLDELPRRLAAGDDIEYAMSGAGNVAHCAIRQRAQQNVELSKMGTTLVAALLKENELYLVHAGDSRAYLLHDGEFNQITQDHSVVQQMIDGGAITEEESEHSPFKNLLSNSLGAAQEIVEFTFQHRHVEDGDRILLCSDGLTNTLSFEQIGDIMANIFESVDVCVEQLIEQSLALGAHDNVTAVVLEVYCAKE